MRRNTLLASIALMVMVVAAACGSAQSQPTPEPPTPTPTTVPEPVSRLPIITISPAEDLQAFIAELPPTDLKCVEGAVGADRYAALTSGSTPEGSERGVVAGCLSNRAIAGYFVGQVQVALGSFSGTSAECIISLVDELPDGALGEILVGLDGLPSQETIQAAVGFLGCLTPEEADALASSGLLGEMGALATGGDQPPGDGTHPGGTQGGRGPGGAVFTPEVQACLAEQLGDDFASGFRGQGSETGDRGAGGSDSADRPGAGPRGGGQQNDRFAAAFETCGVDFGEGGPGGRPGGAADHGNEDQTGSDFQGPGGFGDSSVRECLSDLLGADALAQLRTSGGRITPELQDAIQQCRGPVPTEPGGGNGDGAGPVPPGSAATPERDLGDVTTPTPAPPSDLAIGVLTCLAGELDPAALASVVIATSSGDLSGLTDDTLAALEACGAGS